MSYMNFLMFLNVLRAFFYIIINLPTCFGLRKSPKSSRCLSGKTAIITGGTSGIGFALATKLASRGCKVIIANRHNGEKSIEKIKEITGNLDIVYKHLDLSSLNSVRRFASDICKTEEKIDILVNNAGIGNTEKTVSEDGLNYLMQVNIFGAFLLTHLLLGPLKKSGSAQVLFVSSMCVLLQQLKLKNLNPTEFEMNDEYRIILYGNSKFCNILVAQEFAKKVKDYGITVNAIDPIGGRSPIFNNLGHFENYLWPALLKLGLLLLIGLDFEEVANSYLHVLTKSGDDIPTGQNYILSRIAKKQTILKDDEFCRAIWSQMEDLVKLTAEERIPY